MGDGQGLCGLIEGSDGGSNEYNDAEIWSEPFGNLLDRGDDSLVRGHVKRARISREATSRSRAPPILIASSSVNRSYRRGFF